MSIEESTFNFRSAINGFHREDVVAYLEAVARENEEEQKKLRSDCDKLEKELEETRLALEAAQENAEAVEELEKARARVAELEAENDSLRQQLAAAEKPNQADEAKAAVPEQEAEARTQQTEAQPQVQPDLSEPILPVSSVLPGEEGQARDYNELELAAYRRAEMAERLAKERAQDVYRKILSIFDYTSVKLNTGKTDLWQLTDTLRGNIEQMLVLLTNIRTTYDDAAESFAAVNESASHSARQEP